MAYFYIYKKEPLKNDYNLIFHMKYNKRTMYYIHGMKSKKSNVIYMYNTNFY